MSIGIRLGVESSEVRVARTEVKGLKDDLRGVSRSEPIHIGEGLDESAEYLRQISKEITKLRRIGDAGSKKGFLDIEQFKQASNLSGEIRKNFDSYRESLSRAEAQLEKLVTRRNELKRIEQTAWRKSEREDAAKELKTVDSKIERLSRQLDKRVFTEERLAKQARDEAARIDRMGTTPMSQRLPFKKALGYGAALLGGMSVLGFAQDSISKAIAAQTTAADISQRGGTDLLRPSTLGYTPQESLTLTDTLNRGTGAKGESLNAQTELAKTFARAMGTEVQSIGGYMASIYQPTGADERRYERHLREIAGAVKEGGWEGRIDQFMEQNQQLIKSVSMMRGGAPLTSEEVSRLTKMQSSIWSYAGLAGQGESGVQLMDRLEQGIVRGGSGPGQQMFIMNALAGNVTSARDYWDYVGLREEGLLGASGDPERQRGNLEQIMRHSYEQFGAAEDGSLNVAGLFNLRNTFGLTKRQTEMIDDLYRQGAFAYGSDNYKEAITEVRQVASLEEDAASRMATKGGEHEMTVAGLDDLKVEVGSILMPLIDKFKASLTDSVGEIRDGNFVKAFIKSVEDNPIGKLMVGSLVLGGGMNLVGGAGGFAGGAAGGAGVTALAKTQAGRTALRNIGKILGTGAKTSPIWAPVADLMFPDEVDERSYISEEDQLRKGAEGVEFWRNNPGAILHPIPKRPSHKEGVQRYKPATDRNGDPVRHPLPQRREEGDSVRRYEIPQKEAGGGGARETAPPQEVRVRIETTLDERAREAGLDYNVTVEGADH